MRKFLAGFIFFCSYSNAMKVKSLLDMTSKISCQKTETLKRKSIEWSNACFYFKKSMETLDLPEDPTDPNYRHTFEMNDPRFNKKVKVIVKFGFVRSFYDPTDIRIKGNGLDITIENVHPSERTSAEFYRFWERPLKEWLRFIDEPTNIMSVEIQRGNDEFGLILFHPKYVFFNSGLNINQEEFKVEGQIDDVFLDGEYKVTELPRLSIQRMENAKNNVEVGLTYTRLFTIIRNRTSGRPILQFGLGASVGVFAGYSNSNGQYKGQTFDRSNLRIRPTGHNFGLHQKIYLILPGDRWSFFVEHRNYRGQMNYQWGVPGVEVSHGLRGSNVGFGARYYLFR